MHPVGVELGDHLVAEDLDHLEDLLVLEALVGQAEHQLVGAHGDIGLLQLLAHLLGRAAQHVAGVDGEVEGGLVGQAGGRLGPGGGALPLGDGVVVQAHHRVQVAPAVHQRDLPRPVAVLQADDGVGHHHVVVHVGAVGLGALRDGLLVAVDAALEGGRGLEVEGDGADAHASGGGEGGRVAAGHPQRRVGAVEGFGEDVVVGRHTEVLALVGVVPLGPHAGYLGHHLVPHGLGLGGEGAVEGGHLVAAGAPAGAELEASLAEVVEHGGPLGDANRMLLGGGQAGDCRAQVDVAGLGRDPADHHLRRRHVAVLGEAVVLPEPGELPVVLVGQDHIRRLAHQHEVLVLGNVRRRARYVAVLEYPELHGPSPGWTAGSGGCRRRG